MTIKTLAAGLTLAMALPAAAMAQPNEACLRSNQNSNTTGTVLGAATGALAGGLIGGNATGAIVGGLAGGVLGNRVANSRNDPCPQGYYANPNYRPAGAPAYGANSNYAPGYARTSAYTTNGPMYGHGRDFWRGAPDGAANRMAWLQQRIDRGREDGSLTRQEARRVEHELVKTQRYIDRSQRRYGQLRPVDETYVDQRLDYVSRSIRWARNNG